MSFSQYLNDRAKSHDSMLLSTFLKDNDSLVLQADIPEVKAPNTGEDMKRAWIRHFRTMATEAGLEVHILHDLTALHTQNSHSLLSIRNR